MRAGTLRHRLTFTETITAGVNSFGEAIKTNVLVGEFACRIDALQGRELQAAMQRWAEARYKITMRHQPGVTFTREMQAWWGSPARIMDILDVQDVQGSLRPDIVMFAKDYNG